MAENWTTEQEKAITAGGSCTDILVSASAGSGKTAVLVERIIRMITSEKDPVDIDRILVVTFTRAAAREMKTKIEDALAKKIASADTPADVKERLRRQEIMVPHAHIMTIDGFCRELIAENFNVLDIDPGFNIADENDLRLLKSDIIGEILEERYGSDDRDFLDLSEMYRGDRSGSNKLEEMILSIYNASVSRPEPVRWMESLKQGKREDINADELPAVRYITERIRDNVKACVQDADEIAELTAPHPGISPLYDLAADIAAGLRPVLSCGTFSEMCAYLPLKMADTYRGNGKGEAEKEAAKEARKRFKPLKNIIKERINTLFLGRGADTEEKAIMLFAGAADAFIDLALKFHERFTEAKRDRNILDFGDLEHYALELLTKNVNGVWEKTPKADELSGNFREIMVDEYQDTNEVQELILSSLKNNGASPNRMFMVGDVKQSIYSFRNADPHIFMEKYDSFTRDSGPCMKIDLQANFRSADCVVDPVNAIFENIMTRDTGEMDYDSHQKLIRMRPDVCGEEKKAYIMRIRPDDNDPLTYVERQALEIGREIRRITDPETGMTVFDKASGTFRKAGLSDIGILMRSMAGGKGEEMANKLTELGIYAEVDSTTGFLDSYEVELLLSILSLMDNPDKDIPLASVMLSPAGNFTDSDLVIIKRSSEQKSLYGCCLEAAEKDDRTGKRVKEFLNDLKEMRKIRSLYPLHEYIELLAEHYGLREYVAAMRGGSRRLSNIDLLITRAAEYEKGSYRGLFNFLRYVKRLKEDETVELGESIAVSDSKSVRITTIHKSKGLEYPIVFVADMQKKFNTKDSSSSVLIDDELGIALKSYDITTRTETESIVRKALKNKIKDKTVNEEMRVLYVALTRARDRLYMTGVCADKNKNDSISGTDLWGPVSEGEITTSYIREHLNFLDWVMPVAMRYEGELFEIRDIDADPADIGGASSQAPDRIRPEDIYGTDPDTVYDEELLKNLKERGAEYRFTADTSLPVKFSVSDLKHGQTEETDEEEPALMLPAINDEAAAEEASLLGTAVHKIFEVMDPSRDYSEEDIKELTEDLASKGLIAGRVKDKVDPGFFANLESVPVFNRMRQAFYDGTLKREQQFVISVPASSVYTDMDSSEFVLIQGIIDAYFIEDGKAVIVDYKTDRLKRGTEDTVLRERYGIQMAYYIKALEMTLDIPVKEAVLYSVRNRKEVHIKPEEVSTSG